MPAVSGASEFADDVDGLHDLTGVSSILLISVADEASDEIMDIRSVFVTTMPVFLKKLCDRPLGVVAVDVDAITGFSDARRLAGMGANVEPTKSEYRRFV